MVDIAGIASGLSGAGSFLSGVSGLFGGGGLSSRKAAALDFEYQKRMLENQLQWRVSDAKAAGIHPLYGIGAPAVSYASTIGGEPRRNTLNDLGEAGQGIARAAGAYADSKQRQILFDQEVRMNDLKIKDAEIALAKSASDLAVSSSGSSPAFNIGNVNHVPSKQISSIRGNRGIEAGIPPGTKGYVMADGHTMLLPSEEAAEAMEGNLLYGAEHYLRNRVVAPLLWGARRVRERSRQAFSREPHPYRR